MCIQYSAFYGARAICFVEEREGRENGKFMSARLCGKPMSRIMIFLIYFNERNCSIYIYVYVYLRTEFQAD